MFRKILQLFNIGKKQQEKITSAEMPVKKEKLSENHLQNEIIDNQNMKQQEKTSIYDTYQLAKAEIERASTVELKNASGKLMKLKSIDQMQEKFIKINNNNLEDIDTCKFVAVDTGADNILMLGIMYPKSLDYTSNNIQADIIARYTAQKFNLLCRAVSKNNTSIYFNEIIPAFFRYDN